MRRGSSYRARGMVLVGVLLAGVLGAACTPPPPTLPPGILMSAARSAGFFSFPWPNDIRKTSDGHLDLGGLPGVETNLLAGDPIPQIPLLPQAVARASVAVDDFGRNTAVYFQSGTPIDAATLPGPSASTGPWSTVMLIDLDHGGTRAPVITDLQVTGDRFRPDNLLTVLPYPGHPLAAGTRYAAVVFDGVHDPSGDPLPAAPLLAQLDDPWSASTGVGPEVWSALKAQRDEVRSVVAATTNWDPSDIVAFTAYRTQATDRDLSAIGEALDALETAAPPVIAVTSVGSCGDDPNAGGARTARVEGTLDVPQFQAGQSPYLLEGGDVVVDGTGAAVVQGYLPTSVTVRVPCGDAPAGGWPVAAYVPGTGSSGDIDVSRPQFSTAGWVVGEIPQLYKGSVAPILAAFGIPEDLVEGALFYNFANPVVARSNPLQQAANHVVFLRALKRLSFVGPPLESSGPVVMSPTRDLVAGHSQGAQTLPLVATLSPDVDAVFSSAGSGGQYHSVAHSGLRQGLAAFSGHIEDLDELNPLVQLVQTVIEGSDGINFPTSMTYVNVAGVADDCAVVETSRHFASATGLAVGNIQPPTTVYGTPALDPPTVTLPASANASGRTRISVETAGGHYGASANRWFGTSVLEAVAAGVEPTVGVGPYAVSTTECGRGRYDAPSNVFGR